MGALVDRCSAVQFKAPVQQKTYLLSQYLNVIKWTADACSPMLLTQIILERFPRVQTFMLEDVVSQWSALMGQSMEPPTTQTLSLVVRSVSCFRFCSLRGPLGLLLPALSLLFSSSLRAYFLFVPHLLHSTQIRVNEDINPGVYTFPFFWTVWLQRGKGQIGPLTLLFLCIPALPFFPL